jgi:hypothetical protein
MRHCKNSFLRKQGFRSFMLGMMLLAGCVSSPAPDKERASVYNFFAVTDEKDNDFSYPVTREYCHNRISRVYTARTYGT